MPRIAFIIDTISCDTAGTERQVIALIKGLDRKKFDVFLYCLRDSQWMMNNELPCVTRAMDIHSMASLSCLFEMYKLILMLRNDRIDILQTFFVDANILGTIAGWLARTPIVISSKRNMGHWITPKHKWTLRLLDLLTTHYLANSQYVANSYSQAICVPSSKLTVIGNILRIPPPLEARQDQRIICRKRLGLSIDDFVIGCVSNLRDVKNIPALIRIAKSLSVSISRVRFVVIGEGPDRTMLEQMIQDQGLLSVFLLPGAIPAAQNILPAFDIAVSCSFAESLSNSLLEYMAAGLPVVASRVGGNTECVENGISGLLYEVSDDSQLEDHLRQLIADNQLRTRLGYAARTKVRQLFSVDHVVNRYEQYYVSILPNISKW